MFKNGSQSYARTKFFSVYHGTQQKQQHHILRLRILTDAEGRRLVGRLIGTTIASINVADMFASMYPPSRLIRKKKKNLMKVCRLTDKLRKEGEGKMFPKGAIRKILYTNKLCKFLQLFLCLLGNWGR